MQSGKQTIPPNKVHIVVFAICGLLSLVLLLLGYRGHPPIAIDPAFTLVLSIMGCFISLRTIYFDNDGICIHFYLLCIKRKIPWRRVRCIEIVCKQGTYHILISLDDCPPFYGSGLSLDAYTTRHPIKVIKISVPDGKQKDYVGSIKSYYPNIQSGCYKYE